MLGLNLVNPVRHFGERLVPGNRHPAITDAADRLLQTIGIVVEVFECRRLRADVALAEDIVVVATYREDLFPLELDFDSTHRLAKVAGTAVNRAFFAHAREHTPRARVRVAVRLQLRPATA